jgi:hypothetical protein
MEKGEGGRIIVGNLAKEAVPRFSLVNFKFHFTWGLRRGSLETAGGEGKTRHRAKVN